MATHFKGRHPEITIKNSGNYNKKLFNTFCIVGETGVLRATFFHSHKTAIKLSFSPNFKVAC